MISAPVTCPVCGGSKVVKYGKAPNGKQRFLCQNQRCKCKTFIEGYSEKGCLPQVKQQIIDMAQKGIGVRDTARVLGISTATVVRELKKWRRNSDR